MSSSCSRRTKRRPSPSSPPPEARDWATLPQDALLEIFLRLKGINFSSSSGLSSDMLFVSVCRACPLLKHLKIRFTSLLPDYKLYPLKFSKLIVRHLHKTPLMHELRSIELFNYVFVNEQLSGILDNCPLLESLHVTGQHLDDEMDEQLRAKCARIKNLSIPFEFEPREEDSGYLSFSEEDEFNSRERDSVYSTSSD